MSPTPGKTMRTILLVASFLSATSTAGSEWTAYGGDEGGMRHSSAAEITPENVGDLVPAWTYRTGHASAPEHLLERTKFQATPILIEGKLVLCSPFNVIIALDPATGKEIWRHDPQVSTELRPGNGFNCRGVAYWRDPETASGSACTSRVYTATSDRRLIAVNLADGQPCVDFGKNGVVAVDPEMAETWPGEAGISSAPVIAGAAVIVGSVIADNVNVAAPKGVVHAFDVRTGAPKWSFDPIPRDESAASLGWNNGIPTEGHANVWAPMSVDAARGLVFLPTSSPSPDFFGGLRPGDNRHADSIVALDVETGAVRWAFQTVHHDVWDYDVPAQPLLATIVKGGARRHVVIAATKTGFIFTLDRDTGEPVFPVEERAVPQDGVDGEFLSPTQPFPVSPRPLVPTTIDAKDVYGFTPWDKGDCERQVREARHDGLFTPPTVQGTILYPFTGGGANWGGGTFDPDKNRFYINTSSALHLVRLIPRAETDEDWHEVAHGEQAPMRGSPYAMSRAVMLSPLGLPCNSPPWGMLHAIDMDTGEIVWESVLGTTEELAPLGLALKTGTPNVGGPLSTAGGLIFIGAAMDNYRRAFDAGDGRELWQGKLPAGGQASPMTYMVGGRQYVVIAAGGHRDLDTKKGDYVVAFALPREGEATPARFFDRPGRHFYLNAAIAGVIGIALILGLAALKRRRRRG
jgi:quinoprotein glucose dehydrogenase